MTAIAELNIIPVRNRSMSGEIAKAVEDPLGREARRDD
jgi:hypothetical protein